jgi:hypothetical protein
MKTNFAPAGRYRAGALVMAFCVLGTGCGAEFAFKRGAGASDLDSAKKTCQAKDPAPAAFDLCMADSGWTLKNLSKSDSQADDPVIDITPTPSNTRIENINTPPPREDKEDFVRATSAGVQPAPVVKKTADAMDTFKISSWWKVGSSADSLKADTNSCVAKLGESHKPDAQSQKVTRGLLLCMKEKGWSALRGQ